MFDYTGVAVEIWYQILLAVIDLPYLLDTLVDRQVDLWRNALRYHDPKVYAESEHQRRMLRLVCCSWRDFADEYKYRWITYDSRWELESGKHKDNEAWAVMRSGIVNSEDPKQQETTNLTIRPRRVLFHVASDEDMKLFRITISHGFSKVTTLFVQCAEGYEDLVFESIINQSSKLPMLRCLELPAPKTQSKPLKSLSTAFPKLLSLEINTQGPYQLRYGDQLLLPDAEVIGIDLSMLPATSLQNWHLPGMIHLSTPIGRYPSEDAQVTLEPIRSLGATLTFLNIYRAYAPICLPVEFWKWCPCLVELTAFFSWTYLGSPAPIGHPLKYAIHWPYFDQFNNPLVARISDINTLVAIHSLQFFPPGLEIFVVWKSWSEYLEILSKHNLYTQRKRREILLRMNEISVEKSIRIEDHDRVPLSEFLVSSGIGEAGTPPIHPNDKEELE